ncbi:MAG: pyruvate, water dikinase [Proteobacteria bacterium]|nr:pyruvate, water dikinase [Pseudomonadota bacterium]
MWNFLRSLFKPQKKAAVDEQALRTEFKSRYHHFQQLLVSDRDVHECMVDIEEALHGETRFDMRFVRRITTRATTSTYQVIKHLTSLNPGKYDSLEAPFKAIQAGIQPYVDARREPGTGPLTLDLSTITREHVNLVGAKMAFLAEAGNTMGIPTPRGFVTTAVAYHRFMNHQGLKAEILRRIQAANLNTDNDQTNEEELFQLASSVQQLIIQAPLPDDLTEEILSCMDALADDGQTKMRVAMRSSALGEDTAGASSAGQYKSKLNVSRDEVLLSYKAVVASKYGRRAMTYRANRGIRDEEVAMCVGVMRMVDAVAGGVAYSSGALDPLDLDVTVFSTWGLPKAVVDGAADVDLFRFNRDAPPRMLEQIIACKKTRTVCREDEGTCILEMDDQRCTTPSLTAEQAQRVANLALRLADHFNAPQDIEWALDGAGRIILLQSRTLLRSRAGHRLADEQHEVGCVVQTGPALLTGGSTASSGKAYGAIFTALTQSDLLLFPVGGILVVKQALPSWAPLISRASGVISEMGSAAGHLANIAREFHVPALFGLKGALSSLQNGTLVTLDADACKIHPGRVESLLQENPRPQSPMQGTPVHASLEGAAQHILPLHLLDPDAATDFRPRNCKSLHDIIRFCHEQSVREMFSFGQARDFPQAAAKQLYHDGPKQFWVLNLDDGFRKIINGRFVQLEDIVSTPMLAIWEGMNAVPWQGPPPINTRGFLSVMFEATVNTSLDPAMSSHYSQKNYFMISRNFASLQSRFGFHFCGVEALVGRRDSENYARFQFRGGAADRSRRILRTRLIAELLQERDFRVKLHGDALSARVEGFSQPMMEQRLRALGYLIIHTRQLDMIMADKAEAARKKIELSTQLNTFFTEQTS